jgi:regulator of sirC expression with transglutaminase-like and TPR domain
VALLEYPELDIGTCESALDALALRVRALKPSPEDTTSQLTALRKVLAEDEGFGGDEQNYSDPKNSFLNVVLERRRGLPISLSVLYLEVARRSGIPLFGVAFPGHFVVAADYGAGKLVMDPFHGGAILDEAGCTDLLSRVAPQVKFSDRLLVPTAVRSVIARMLNNLKRSYLSRQDGERALRAFDLLLLLNPDHPGELRQRAHVLSGLGAFRAALADVERCLELSPHAPDHVNLRLAARALRQRVAFLN